MPSTRLPDEEGSADRLVGTAIPLRQRGPRKGRRRYKSFTALLGAISAGAVVTGLKALVLGAWRLFA